jgi:hypothetical protein
MRTFLYIFLLLTQLVDVKSQVKKVSYDIRYNNQTGFFDAYLIINEGHANQAKDRIQFNAQFSFIAPSNSSISIAKSYMPLLENRSYKGIKPVSWEITSELLKVRTLDNMSVYGVTPKLSSTAFYNDLSENDEVKLFSIEVAPIPKEIASVRLFRNGIDGISKKLNGSDFSNGFTLGSVAQLYVEKKTIDIKQENRVNNKTFHSRIYPNPAVDHINIEINNALEQNVTAEIYSSTGKTVLKNIINKKIVGQYVEQLKLDVYSGIYSIKIISGNQSATHQLIITNPSASGINRQNLTGLQSFQDWIKRNKVFAFLILVLILSVKLYLSFNKKNS